MGNKSKDRAGTSSPAAVAMDGVRRLVRVLRSSNSESERRAGITTAQLSLSYGADDLDGSVVEYKITHDADHYGTPQTMTREHLLELIRDAGFVPVERDTRYHVLKVYDGPDPARRDQPQPMPV